MKTIKLLLCILLTAISFNIFADEVGRYQILLLKPIDIDPYKRNGVLF